MAISYYGDLEGSGAFGKANAITPTCEAGRVYLREHAPCLNDSWTFEYVPAGSHDDYVIA